MKTVENTATITADGVLFVNVPPGIAPGQHRVVVIIDEKPPVREPQAPLELRASRVGSWPESWPARREST